METHTHPTSRTALPSQHTSFVGRETELAEMTALLADPLCRLLTLVGPGGSGKTRLAIEVARQLDFADGVFAAPLQPLQSPEQVVGTIINVLNMPPDNDLDQTQLLLAYLQAKRLLLVLDNFEHLMAAADLVAEILEIAPQVKLLVTSREPLNLHEEWVREVRGLTYPNNGAISDAPHYSALQLFAARARRLKADFSLNDEYEHVVRISQLVDGLPLALELAAGWLRTLSCEAIAHEIENNVDVLASNTRNLPERHRSMRAVFDHSWRLLTDEERVVLPRFSVFRGGCTREAAAHVAGATLPILASLVEKSLLRHDSDTDRYDMQELLRQYAQEQLEESGEGDRVRDAHAHYYATLFYARREDQSGPDKQNLLRMLTAELDNVRVSWAWALECGHYEVIDQLVELLWMYFTDHSSAFELGTLCRAASECLAGCVGAQERAIHGRILARQAKWEMNYAHYERAETLFRQSMTIALEQDNLTDYYYSLRWLAGHVLFRTGGDLTEIHRMLEECISFYRKRCDKASLSLSLCNLAHLCIATGEQERRRQALLETYQLNREMAYPQGIAESLYVIGWNASIDGEWSEAEQRITEAIMSFQQCGNRRGVMATQATLSYVVLMQGDLIRAEQLCDAALALRQTPDNLSAPEFEVTFDCALTQSLIADIRGELAETFELIDSLHNLVQQRGEPLEAKEWERVTYCWILCSMAQFDTAFQVLMAFLAPASQYHVVRSALLFAVACLTRILAHRGETTGAVELMALVFTHPNGPRGYLERHQGMTQLRADLEAQLGPETYATAWERGATLDVEQTARDLLREFGSTEADPIASANQSLPDPLTFRELDVLALLADGLTNPQIAERLFITTGTVKGHVNKILYKLDAQDRHQAVIRARKLHLLNL